MLIQTRQRGDQHDADARLPTGYASATEMADVVSSVLLSSAPGQRTAASQSLPFEQRMRGSGGWRALYAVRAQVVPNERTNTLIVTATPSNLAIAAMVIEELDKQVEYETTTYVLPLANAQAIDVAFLLEQALRTGDSHPATTPSSATGAAAAARTTYRRVPASAASQIDRWRGPRAGGECARPVRCRMHNEDAQELWDSSEAASSRHFWIPRRRAFFRCHCAWGAGSGQIVNLLDLAGQATVIAIEHE